MPQKARRSSSVPNSSNSSLPAKTATAAAVSFCAGSVRSLVILCLVLVSATLTVDADGVKRPHAHIPVPIHNKYNPPQPGAEKPSVEPDFASTRAFASEDYNTGENLWFLIEEVRQLLVVAISRGPNCPLAISYHLSFHPISKSQSVD